MERVFLLFQITNWSTVEAVQTAILPLKRGGHYGEVYTRVFEWKDRRLGPSLLCRGSFSESGRKAERFKVRLQYLRIFFNEWLKVYSHYAHLKVSVICGLDTLNLPMTGASLQRYVNTSYALLSSGITSGIFTVYHEKANCITNLSHATYWINTKRHSLML